ncbi:hypothetical protein HY004_01065 [Candidatus Saccharibacteria bacterium]|nr:hypothetical protein [Candidatus Saccharibacteria bacterium]
MQIERWVDIIQSTIQKSARLDEVVVVLDCGHFDSKLGVDDFSINSTNIAGDIYMLSRRLRKKGLKFVFSVLRDDVGMTCSLDDDSCEVDGRHQATEHQVPAEILKSLQKIEGFRSEKVKLFSEKTARNRGIQFFRKQKKMDALGSNFLLEKKDDQSKLLFRLSDDNKVLLADILDDAHWIGHCPLLMGMHYVDIAAWAKKIYIDKSKVLIIDFSMSYDKGKVNAGAEVALDLNAPQGTLLGIINVCSSDEEFTVHTTDIKVA